MEVARASTPLKLDGGVLDRRPTVPLAEAHMVARALLRLEEVGLLLGDSQLAGVCLLPGSGCSSMAAYQVLPTVVIKMAVTTSCLSHLCHRHLRHGSSWVLPRSSQRSGEISEASVL